MPIEVNMAKISPTMESGQVVKWLVKVGDRVKEGDTLAEVQTDKAVMPMEAFDEGVVALIDAPEGQEIPVGQRVLVLASQGEDPKQVAASLGKAQGAKAAPAAKAEAAARATEPAQPQRAERAGAAGENGQRQAEAGAAQPPAREPAAATAAATSAPAGGRVKSSPLARKIAAAEQVDLQQVKPSGPGGRVVRRDVEAFLEQRAKSPARPAAAAPAPAAAGQRVPLSRIRATIAQRMTEAHRNAPDIHVTVDIRMDQTAAIREQLNAQLAAENIKLSLSDFVTKAVAMSLRAHPGVNATFEDNAIVQHAEVNVGIAVALEGGLIVPVLRNADALGLREIRTGSMKLFEAARQMRLTSEQMIGATFTISNLGMYGVRQFDAILNLPQVGILAVGAAEKRPVVNGDALGIGLVMTVTMTADHRAVDGALAAEFVRTLKGLLEEPASMLL